MTFDKFLERAVNVTVLIVCIAVGVRYASTAFPLQHRAQRKSVEYNSKNVNSFRPQQDSGGVLLSVASSCTYCERSLPFYRELAKSLRKKGKSLLVSLASNDAGVDGLSGLTTAQEYVNSRGLLGAVPVVLPAQAGLRLRGTPTLLTYRSDGKITGLWRGMLDGAGQKDVAATLATE